MSNFEKKVVPYLTYLGLRPGEKLYEEKLMAEEGLKKTRNELIHGYILSQVPLSIKGELVFLGLSIVLAVFLWLIVDKTKIVQRKLLKIS